jgi:DNA polymerase-3 subunit alpha (Gram-positive type)
MLFFDAFDQLSADQELKKLYTDVDVVKIIASRQNGNVYICIKSTRIISWGNIKKMEELLNRQLFLHTNNKAVIKPSYELTSQYTLERLFPIYRDSILEEIKDESIVTYHILSEAGININEMNLIISVTDSCVVREKMSKLKDFLQTMFQERFDYTVTVTLDYIQPSEEDNEREKDIEYSKLLLRAAERDADNEGGTAADDLQSVGSIRKISEYDTGIAADAGAPRVILNSNSGLDQNTGVKQNMQVLKKTTSGQNNSNTSFKPKNAYDKGKSSYRKLPSDPSVVYGRNFDGNLISICDITDEIGEVVIRGKLIKPDIGQSVMKKVL